jgi:hypothetical protein
LSADIVSPVGIGSVAFAVAGRSFAAGLASLAFSSGDSEAFLPLDPTCGLDSSTGGCGAVDADGLLAHACKTIATTLR